MQLYPVIKLVAVSDLGYDFGAQVTITLINLEQLGLLYVRLSLNIPDLEGEWFLCTC